MALCGRARRTTQSTVTGPATWSHYQQHQISRSGVPAVRSSRPDADRAAIADGRAGVDLCGRIRRSWGGNRRELARRDRLVDENLFQQAGVHVEDEATDGIGV